jgi:hypothetical protein
VKELLTLAGIIISAVVALVIANLHRKQMRQIEVFRRDPTQGLHPPPSRFRALLSSYGWFFFGFILGVLLLIGDLVDTGPITRLTILQIVFHASLIGLFLMLGLVIWVIDRTTAKISKWSLDITDVTRADQTKK